MPSSSTVPDVSFIPVDAENNPFTVWLIGMMACGKSTVARILEPHLGAHTVEMDKLIAQSSGQSIPDFFKTPEGIENFRLREKWMVASLSINPAQAHQIISTGGGAPCFHGNMHQMIRSGLVVYLKWAPEVLAQRTFDQDQQAWTDLRPILAKMDVPARTAKIIELMWDREKYYNQAHVIVDTGSMKPQDVVDYIVSEGQRLFQK